MLSVLGFDGLAWLGLDDVAVGGGGGQGHRQVVIGSTL
jgi:hypothetical protein